MELLFCAGESGWRSSGVPKYRAGHTVWFTGTGDKAGLGSQAAAEWGTKYNVLHAVHSRAETTHPRSAAHHRPARLTLMKEFMMDMALEEIPVSGCTCFSTL